MEPDNQDYEQAEVVNELGNMMVVRINGKKDYVPATHKNKLLYKSDYNMYELFNSDDSRFVLTDEDSDEYYAIASTMNDSVYQIWSGSDPYPIITTPDVATEVLKAVKAILDDNDYTKFDNLYNRLRGQKVRRSIMEKVINIFPKNAVIPEDDGWVIHGVFRLKWDNMIYLNKNDVDTYRVHSSGVEQTNDRQPFLKDMAVSDEMLDKYRGQKVKVQHDDSNIDTFNSNTVFNKCPCCDETVCYECYDEESDIPTVPVNICQSCDVAWKEFELSEKEIQFLGRAKMLIDYREQYEDDVFWDIIESYVWYDS